MIRNRLLLLLGRRRGDGRSVVFVPPATPAITICLTAIGVHRAGLAADGALAVCSSLTRAEACRRFDTADVVEPGACRLQRGDHFNNGEAC